MTEGLPPAWPTRWSVDPDWHTDDSFWEHAAPALFSPARWDTAETEAIQLLALLGVMPPDRILDLACGPGRHALPLAQYGYDVTGLDRTEAFLAQLRARAVRDGVAVTTILADLRTAGPLLEGHAEGPAPFDAILWLDSSIGYGSEADDIAALRAAHGMARQGGRLIIEGVGLETVVESGLTGPSGALPLELETLEVGGDPWVLERRIATDPSGAAWMEVRWGPAPSHPRTYRHRLYGAQDLMDVVLEAGWSNPMTYGDLSGSPYDADSERLVVAAVA